MAGNLEKSIQDAVAFGQKLAMLLQTWVDLSFGWGSNLRPILADISTTSSVLQQLQGLVDADQPTAMGQPAAEILTKKGIQEVETLAVKCDVLYKTIMLLLQNAYDRDEESPIKDDKDLGGLKARLLFGSVPDPSSLRSIGIMRKLYGQKHWISLRLDRCKEQLRWVKQQLLIILHIAKLAQLQNNSVDRDEGTFEQELLGRGTIHALCKGTVKYTQKKARKQEKTQRQWELQAKSDDSDASSISSSASSTKSGTTASTAVDVQQPSKEEAAVAKDNTEQTGQEKKTLSFFNGCRSTHEPSFNVVVKQESLTPEKQTLSEGAEGVGRLDVAAIGTPAKPLCSFSCSMSLNMKLPLEWTHRIFGKDDVFKKDWESHDLEAYIYESPIGYTGHRVPRKIPFGHRRLHHGLKQVLKDKDKIGSTWDRYIDLGPNNRWVVDELAREANKNQTRERICIALQEIDKEGKDTAMLIFFSIREERQPISLTDPVGKTYKIPYERCRTMAGLKSVIKEAFNYTPEIGPHVTEGHFDIINSKGDILLPGLWKNTIKPGEKLTMRMWPLSTPLRGFYNSPPYCPPVPIGPGPPNESHYQAMMRMHRIGQHNGIRVPQGGMGLGMPPPRIISPHGTLPMMPPPPPHIIRHRRSRSLSSSSIDDESISEEQDKQLMVIDFVKEREKNMDVTAADLLLSFTNLKDTMGQDCLDAIFSDDAYDSDDSDASSSSSSSIIDD